MHSETPPAPPPISSGQGGHQNPYDFILNPSAPQKKGLFSGNGSKNQRLILIVAGAVMLLLLVIGVVGLLSGSGGALKQDWQSLAQQQTEIIRVSDIGVQKAGASATKNLAITTKLSLESSQADLLGIAKKAGADIDIKKLEQGKDAQTDSKLTQAEQANKFDEVFTETIRTELQAYQQQLQKIYDASKSYATRSKLSEAYSSVQVLLDQEQK